MRFQDELTSWYDLNKRDLPWRNTNDPYIIWLSEVILQQTRVEQGTPYFQRFREAYPTVRDLAAASEAEVLKLWQGLGYYSRGRNLRLTALQVVDLHAGVFPVDHGVLLSLKGIGAYTAAAISSIAGNYARAVVDGNVYRVLARYFGIHTPIDSTIGKRQFQALADELIVDTEPARYNQAIMEFGALICKPAKPLCNSCVLREGCYARMHGQVSSLPVKEKKLKKRTRYFHYLVMAAGDRLMMNKRHAGDIWQGLYDFPMVETTAPTTEDILRPMAEEVLGGQISSPMLMTTEKHLLTHQTLFLSFYRIDMPLPDTTVALEWIDGKKLNETPMPIVIHNFIAEYFG